MMTHAHSTPPLSAETLWPQLRLEAETLQKKEPALAALAQGILSEKNFQGALGKVLSGRLASAEVSAATLYEIFSAARTAAPEIETATQRDLLAVMQYDPAAHDIITPFLFFKGFHALQTYRFSHWLWRQNRKHMALHLQSRASALFGVDVHPAASFGSGIMFDHATGIVIGETSVVEDNVLFWHGVTLGSKDLVGGDRHPKIRQGARLGAGSSVLGPIEIGVGARVAAGSVVLDNVPAGVTVAGIPAKAVHKTS